MEFNRGNFVSALAGLIIGVMVVAMLPAGAADGDSAILGTRNTSLTSTKFQSRNSTQLINTKAGRPALRLYVRDGAPPMAVESQVKVDNLNADLLDGMDASAFSPAGHPHAWSDLVSGIPEDLADGDDDTVYTDGEAVAAVLAADGASSGLDADLLDGSDSGDFAASAQRCPYGWTAAGFDDEGGIKCGGAVTLDESGGDEPSMVIDASGYPVIAYGASDNLRLARCHDPYCISFTINTIDSDPLTHRWKSLALDASGYPVVSYYDDTEHELRLAHCVDATCEAAASIEVVDTDGDVGAYNSMVLDASGFPVIAYTDYKNSNLKVAHCVDANCASPPSIETAAEGEFTGEYTSIALDASGYPVIAFYHDQISNKLRLAHCSDADCTDLVTVANVDTTGASGQYASMKLDASGYPVIAYFSSLNDDLRVAHCNNAACDDPSIETVASEGSVGFYVSLVLDASGNPMVVYRDHTDDEMELAVCGDADCTSAVIYVISSGDGAALGGTSMVLRDGFPIVVHHQWNADHLEIVFP